MNFKDIIFIISKIIGINPFHVTNSQSSFMDYFLMLFVPILYFVSFVVLIFFDINIMHVEGCKSICFYGNMAFAVLGIFSYGICFWSSFNRKKFITFFYNEINKLDEHLKLLISSSLPARLNATTITPTTATTGAAITTNPPTLQSIMKFKFKKDYVQIIMIAILGLSLIVIVIFEFIYLQNYFFSVRNLFLYLISCYFPYISVSLLQLIFVCLVKEIGQRFEQVNFIFKIINKECDVHQSNRLKIFDIEMNGKSSKTDKLSSKSKKMENKDNAQDETDDFYYATNFNYENGTNCEQFMVPLFQIHEKINTLGEITNNEYATQVVAYMTSTFIISIFGIFLTTKVLFTIGGKNEYVDKMAISFILWTMYLLIVAYLVLRLCCNAQKEGRKTALLTHEIIQKKPTFMLGNDECYNKMKCFTLQYLHWEKFFRFNGIGLFQLDYTFIFSAVSAATSYLIVLLQFNMDKVLDLETKADE